MKVRLRAFILDPMIVGSYKVVQNDRMSKLRRFLVLLVPNVSVTKVVRQACLNTIGLRQVLCEGFSTVLPS